MARTRRIDVLYSHVKNILIKLANTSWPDPLFTELSDEDRAVMRMYIDYTNQNAKSFMDYVTEHATSEMQAIQTQLVKRLSKEFSSNG